MTEERPGSRIQRPSTYAEILVDVAYPWMYVVVAIVGAISFLIYSSVLVHIHVPPIYTGELAATISSKGAGVYWAAAVAFGLLTALPLHQYLRWNNG